MPRWLMALWLLVLLVGVCVLVPPTHAAHFYGLDDQRHMATMHLDTPRVTQGHEDEVYCTEVVDSTAVTNETLRGRVLQAIGITGGWSSLNPLANPRVQFTLINTTSCKDLSQSDQDKLRVRFVVFKDTRYTNGSAYGFCEYSEPVNCVVRDVLILDRRFSPTHRHQYIHNVLLLESLFTNQPETIQLQIINHEIGHTLGLQDPDAATACDDTYLPSVMHIRWYLIKHGCESKSYTESSPSQKDRDRVRWVQQSLNFLPNVPIRR